MKKSFKIRKLIKKIVIILILIYIAYILINQQKTLNSYIATQAYYKEEIASQEEYKESLYQTKNNINSKEYIEETAREKLDMYLPNERVYVDIEN